MLIRPRGLILWHHLPTGLFFVGLGIAAMRTWSTSTGIGVCVGAGGVVAVLTWSAFFTRIELDQRRIRVRNLVRSHTVPFDELAAIERREVWLLFGGPYGWSELTLRTRAGTSVPVLATLLMNRTQAARTIDGILASGSPGGIASSVAPRMFPRKTVAHVLEASDPPSSEA